jgi:SAM-dependent methyltransferase
MDDVRYYKRDFWGTENLKYVTPHFRMRKVARVIRGLSRGRECDLLDVGCGPGTLGGLLPPNVRYHGIDLAIPEPAPNLLEMDILSGPFGFRDMRFDLVVAQGLFEYIGRCQSQKFADIAALLKDGGKFVLTYQNFGHRKPSIYWPYSNVQKPADFRGDLRRFFRIERSFAGSHNWNHSQPNRAFMRASQAHLNVNIPLVSPLLGVDYFYICSAR